MKADVYQKVTDKIIADLEKGELSWLKPWNAGNLEGRITKPLRHNGMPYNGINVLMLWGASVEAGYLSPYWMTFSRLLKKSLRQDSADGEPGNPPQICRRHPISGPILAGSRTISAASSSQDPFSAAC